MKLEPKHKRMKLEPKHLAPYLPYKLKLILKKDWHNENWNDYDVVEMMQITLSDKWFYIGANKDKNTFVSSEQFQFKPILHPLSDLLKDEYSFIYENETDYDTIKDCVYMDHESFRMSKFSFEFWEDLFRYHFDVFGLIDDGLAIDINTLKGE